MIEISDLDRAYRSAIYEVYTEKETIRLSIASNNPQLDLLLSQYNSFTWAFITAYNPHSQCLPAPINQQRHQDLLRLVKSQGFTFFEGVGKDEKGLWTPEISLLILGIKLPKAIALGKKFQQNALVYGKLKEISQLVWLVS